MSAIDRKKLYQQLSAAFPEETIERVKGSASGRPYDSASVRTQFLINRLNEVLGVGGYRIHRTINVQHITTAKGRTMYEAVADMCIEIGEWVDGKFVVIGESVGTGGHTSASRLDAEKGAHTNAVKRTLAGFGVGKATFEGTLDDDSRPADEWGSPAPVLSRSAQPAPAQPTMTVVRAPAAQAQPQREETPPGYIRTPTATEVRQQVPERSRLSSRQLAALWSLARKLGIEQSTFRARVKATHGVLEFISREAASQLISQLSAQLNGNGHANDDAQPPQGAA